MDTLTAQEQEIRRLRALNALLRATRNTLDIREVLRSVRDHMHSLVPFDRLGLLVAESRGRYCLIQELVTLDTLTCCPPGSIMPIAGTAIEWVFRELRSHYNGNLAEQREFLEDETLWNDQIRSIVRVPLYSSGDVYGVMTVKSVRVDAFSLEDISLLEEIGLQISGALFAAKHVAELKLHAMTDPLTGIYNRRALHSLTSPQHLTAFLDEFMIEGEWERIESRSVLVIDVDDFKLYNDTYGHAEGDRRLCQLVQTLRYATPAHQLLFRYGGDEFIILLPNASELESHSIASHIRQAAYKTGDHQGVPMSVSIGIHHDVWGDLENMIRKADAAMYDSKKRRADIQTEVGLS
ncbi:MAG: sensor domain-containing diguanylate cyclase [Firmicutes bacterium]|nr:sensor domain-containing diguanylate cyclase [Bacillota bacterium]